MATIVTNKDEIVEEVSTKIDQAINISSDNIRTGAPETHPTNIDTVKCEPELNDIDTSSIVRNVIVEDVSTKKDEPINITNENVGTRAQGTGWTNINIDTMKVETEMENIETSSNITAKIEHDIADVNNSIAAITEQLKEDSVKSAEVSEDESEGSKLVNPLKRKLSGTLRRKKKKIQKVMVVKDVDIDPPVEVAEGEPNVDTSMEVEKEDVEYCLTVSNLPNSWSFMEIKNYIDTECGPVDEIEMIKDEKTGLGAIRLSYQTEIECKSAMQKLNNKEVAGNKLVLEMTVVGLESGSESKSDTTESKKPWKPDLDSWEVDLQGMYGLKLQFLRSLGITPPLDKWVHVSNFRCDKSELRDIMEMAGSVQMCSVFSISHRYANVMYSHPLEAVQAVSMLNNQIYYGQQLKVAMDRSPDNTILLPKGLKNIGKGLGLNGKPLKNIVKHYERFVDDRDCLINPAVFDIPENHSMKLNNGFESVEFKVKSVEEFNYPIAAEKSDASKVAKAAPVVTVATPKPAAIIIPPKPVHVHTQPFSTAPPKPVVNFTPPTQTFQQHNSYAPNFRPPFSTPLNMMNMQGMQGPQGPIRGMQPGPPPVVTGPPRPPPPYMRPFMGPPGPPRPTWGPPPGPIRPPINQNEPVKLILSNLPPSATFALLCEKMSEWGHVVCIQLTTPGSAVVTFGNRMQADACYKFYNGRNIDNHFIQLKYA